MNAYMLNKFLGTKVVANETEVEGLLLDLPYHCELLLEDGVNTLATDRLILGDEQGRPLVTNHNSLLCSE